MKKPVAFITGAGRGIGRSIALALSGAGYRLALTARKNDGLIETANLCKAGDAILVPANLTEPGAPESLAEHVIAKAGGLDVLVNNAGAVYSGSVDDTNAENWDQMMAINARAPFLLTRACLPALRRSPQATIVNIGSVVSEKGYPMQSAYAASKHALAGWTKSLAAELQGSSIRVHLIMPGGVATDMVLKVRPDIDPSDLIAPDEIAAAVGFLIKNRGGAVIDSISMHRLGKTPFT